ncbi:MAG: RluA family pseudouridine synthase [Lachnospiraceae bacterium]|nr:RluA family pseudouridine synthase [Lachnospiraceae bacterium]
MHKKIITSNEANQRLDKFLHKYLPEAGNSFIFKMLRKKNITLNGKKATGSEKTLAGDEVTFFMSDETLSKFQAKPESSVKNYYEAFNELTELKVLFENEHLLIVDKPAGILCQKAKAGDISLNEWLIGYLLTINQLSEESLKTFKPSVLNRLDRNTSGIVLCGKTLMGSQEISRLLKEKRIKKYYQLIVKGKIQTAGELCAYLHKDGQLNKVKVWHENEELPEVKRSTLQEGKKIITKYRPLKSSSTLTLLEALLITGKTHQIRASFAAMGHPLVGDYKYGEFKINNEFKRLDGVESQLLNACRVVFPQLNAPLEDLSGLEIHSKEPELFERIKAKHFGN